MLVRASSGQDGYEELLVYVEIGPWLAGVLRTLRKSFEDARVAYAGVSELRALEEIGEWWVDGIDSISDELVTEEGRGLFRDNGWCLAESQLLLDRRSESVEVEEIVVTQAGWGVAAILTHTNVEIRSWNISWDVLEGL